MLQNFRESDPDVSYFWAVQTRAHMYYIVILCLFIHTYSTCKQRSVLSLRICCSIIHDDNGVRKNISPCTVLCQRYRIKQSPGSVVTQQLITTRPWTCLNLAYSRKQSKWLVLLFSRPWDYMMSVVVYGLLLCFFLHKAVFTKKKPSRPMASQHYCYMYNQNTLIGLFDGTIVI